MSGPGSVVEGVARRALHRALALPRVTLRRALGPPRVNDEGMELDLQIQALLSIERRLRAAPRSSDPARRRAQLRRAARLVAGDPPPVERVLDGAVPGPRGPIPVRHYRTGGDKPALVWFHGGGFVAGDLDTHDGLCRRLAVGADCDVISVAYRLAPEHRFPAAVDDALAAWRALSARHDRAVVGGDSAGGCLAAVVGQLDRARPPDGQLLVYPLADARRVDPSHRTFAEGYLLTAADIAWYLGRYRPDPDDPRASPALAPDLSGLPPAVVHLAGFDPLRDEGRRYAARLRASGVPVVLREHGALIHGFACMTALDGPAAAVSVMVEDLRALLRGELTSGATPATPDPSAT